MRYTTKHICRICHVTREALRFYEREGIISPRHDRGNNYRYYDYQDINRIFECKRYRAMGFGIKEIRSMLDRDGRIEYLAKLRRRREELKREIRLRRQAIRQADGLIAEIEQIGGVQEALRISDSPARFFSPVRRNDVFDLEPKALGPVPVFQENLPFVENMIYIPMEELLRDAGGYEWGYGLSEESARLLAVDTDGMQYFGSCRCVCTVVDVAVPAGDEEAQSVRPAATKEGLALYEGLGPVLEQIRKEGMRICGPLIGTLLVRLRDGDLVCPISSCGYRWSRMSNPAGYRYAPLFAKSIYLVFVAKFC